LRVELDGCVPADIPTAGSRVYLSGIRKLEGFDWRDDGVLYVADHGPSGELGRSGHDEVSLARAGDNLGWPDIFGCEARDGRVSPSIAFTKAHPPGGVAFYGGDTLADWKNALLIGTLGTRELLVLHFDAQDPKRVTRHEAYFRGDAPEGHGRLRDVVIGPDGAPYVTTSNCDGRGTCPTDKDRILKLVPGP
jgi:glucose/arabinose dehydrogenase